MIKIENESDAEDVGDASFEANICMLLPHGNAAVIVKREVDVVQQANSDSEPVVDWSSTVQAEEDVLLEESIDIKFEVYCDSSNPTQNRKHRRRRKRPPHATSAAASDSSFSPEEDISTDDDHDDYEHRTETAGKIRNVLCSEQKVCKPEDFPTNTKDAQVCLEEKGGKLYFRDMEVKKNRDGKFQCPFPCDQTLSNKKSLKRHITRFHVDLSDAYSCDQCDRKFYFRFQLARHVQEKHSGGYRCDECGENLSTLCTLSRHKRLKHLGLRPHVCEHCGKSFGMKKNLTYHMKQHR